MRIKEITENYISNQHMGMGTERPDDQRIMELGDDKLHLLGKIARTGQIVRIVKRVDRVQFSDKPDWLLVDMDLNEKGKEFKWLPGDTRFTWVKEFTREELAQENTAFGIGDQDAGGNWANTGAKFHQM